MHLECVFISEMDKWWLIHHSQIECCVCQRSGMVCQRQNLCLCREKKQKIWLQNSLNLNLPTSQFSCMIPWLIHTSTNRLLHQGAAFWLWDQCRQRDKVLLQVGRLIEEEIDSWFDGGLVVGVSLSLLQCCHCHCCNVVRIVVSMANRIDLPSILQRALLQHRHQDWEWTNQALADPTANRLLCFAH